MRRACLVCGTEFEPRTHRQKYCCKACRQRQNREDRRRWGYERGENQGSWNSPERTDLYARQAVGALDEDARWALAMLLGGHGGYNARMMADWLGRSLCETLREIERTEEE